MIVRDNGTVVHLITQPDHAALARRVMERWAPLHHAERRASILLAVEEHDNGWREPDAEPLVSPEGRVFDFINTPVEVRQSVWPRGVGRLAEDDTWAAALVAQHALTVYDRYRSDPAWDHFFVHMAATRDALVAASRHSDTQLRHDYAFVRIGDLISLIFCNEWDEEQSFDRWKFRREADRVIVTPDPFAGREIPLAVNARELPNGSYTSNEQLHEALRGAPWVTVTGRCVGATAPAVL
jgi:hypothetical protein